MDFGTFYKLLAMINDKVVKTRYNSETVFPQKKE